MQFARFMAVVHRVQVFWWPFPFLRPDEGRAFGRFRLFSCALLYLLFFWSWLSIGAVVFEKRRAN
ncbi:hypothetical protein [Microbulbifer discodermiae]|uniref:hypothetical protein n=1 Tax=Microbulbifer sp. 2201CG32-9 TaxID=3232309 RepID=UPI00345BD093